MTMTLKFADMMSSSIFLNIFLFLLLSLVAGPCQYHHWFRSYANLLLQGADQKSGNRKYSRLNFAQYRGAGAS